MTCIVAMKNKRGKIYIGADRRTCDDRGTYQTRPVPKVIKREGLILAGCGDSYLLDQIARHMAIPKNDCPNSDVYIHNWFYKAVSKLLINKGLADDNGNLKIPAESFSEIVIALDGHLYSMLLDTSISIEETSLPYATGSGGEVAWGSILTTEGSTLNITERIKMAITVAAVVNVTCDNQLDIEHE